jgi:hypothetical protein
MCNIPTNHSIIESHTQYTLALVLYNTIAPNTPMAIAPAPTYEADAAFVDAATGLADAVRDALIDMEPLMAAVAEATTAGMLVMVTPASAQSPKIADVSSNQCVSTHPPNIEQILDIVGDDGRKTYCSNHRCCIAQVRTGAATQ